MKEFKRISDMEKLFDEVMEAQDSIEKEIENYKNIQEKVQRLEKYYASKQWKDDFDADERGEIPSHIKRGVLSEDGIYDLLERNKEIMDMLDSLDKVEGNST